MCAHELQQRFILRSTARLLPIHLITITPPSALHQPLHYFPQRLHFKGFFQKFVGAGGRRCRRRSEKRVDRQTEAVFLGAVGDAHPAFFNEKAGSGCGLAFLCIGGV